MSEAQAARKDATRTPPRRQRPRPLHNAKQTASLAIVKRPRESVNRPLSLEKPGSELLDDYYKFVDHTPDYVANFALPKRLARDRGYRKCKASNNGPGPVPVEAIAKRSR
jgi:hypothetical protein